MKKESGIKTLSILLVAVIALSMVPLLTVTIRAATEAQIENAITIGVEWLAADQETDGSWPAYAGEDAATTGLAVLKLEHRAYELGYDSPFDPNYKYHGNVTAGLDYLFSKLFTVSITLQDHTTGATGSVDDPDFNNNGLGVYAHNHTYPFDVYDTGIVLSAISASGTPDKLVSVSSSPVNGWKYSKVAQDMVDWLAWAQADTGLGEGGWEYKEADNGPGKYPDDPNAKSTYGPDNSNSGYAVLGLGYAENFGCTVPQWVKTELNAYIGNIQDPVDGDTNDGGSWYTAYSTAVGVNILKTGNLIFEMALVGDTQTTIRVVDALDYLARHWSDASGTNTPPGWDGNPAQYQAMFCAMKGLEYMGIDTFDSVDWYADFSDKIVAQQCTTPGGNYGSWQQSSGRGFPTIITAWALLTLEKTAPPHRNVDKKVYVELLKNGDFSSGLACWSVRVENGATVQTHDGPTWLSTIRPLGPGWTDINLVNEPGRTNVLDVIQTVSDGDGDWTGAYQTLNKDVSGFNELYFEADGKAMFQSLAGDGWVGGEYPVHFIIQYEDINGIQHDTWLGWPANPAWQQGFYYLSGNLPNEPYSTQMTQNAWFHYKSPNLMNLSPAPKTIKTVRLYSSGWAYHGRIDNAQLYGTPPSANLGDVIHVKIEVTVPSDETATIVDKLPKGLSYLSGTFTVNGVPATPTFTKIGLAREVSYTITESGTHLIEFDCKVDEAKSWKGTEVCNVVASTWYDEENNPIETKEDIECFTIHAFDSLVKDIHCDDWPMFHHDLALSGVSTSLAPNTNATLWIYDTQSSITSSPAVVDGKLYIGLLNGSLIALDANTGAPLWNFATGAPIYSSPAVEYGNVYILSENGNVYAINANTGTLVWSRMIGNGPCDWSSPAVHSGKVFIASSTGWIRSLDATTGAIIWSTRVGGCPNGPIAVVNGKVYSGTHNFNNLAPTLVALDELTGAVIWTYDYYLWHGGVVGFINSNGVSVADGDADGNLEAYFGVVTWTGSGPQAICLDEATGNEVWTQNINGWSTSTPAVHNGVVFIGSDDNNLYALNASTGGVMWTYTTGAPIWSAPAVADGKVFVASLDHIFYAIDEATGNLVWKYDTSLSRMEGSPAVACGKVFVGNENGKVYAWGTPSVDAFTIKEETEVRWTVEISVTNPFTYTMKNVTITDNFGAELEIDHVEDPRGDVNCDGIVDIFDLSRVASNYGERALQHPDRWDPVADINNDGFVDARDLAVVTLNWGLTLWLTGESDKVHLFWYIGDLAPGETAKLIITVSTDVNPGGQQEYTEPDVYEMNSGATLKFDDCTGTQLSAVTASIYVTVLPENDC